MELIIKIVIIILVVFVIYIIISSSKTPNTINYVMNRNDGTSVNIEDLGQSKFTKYNTFQFTLPSDNVDGKVNNTPLSNAQHLNYNQAMIIYGNIPYRYLYWSINGYNIRDGNITNLGNPISISRVNGECNDGIAVIMTSNYNMYEAAKFHINKYWKQFNPRYKFSIFPIFISDHNPESKYMFINRTTIRNELESLPSWNCFIYTTQNIPLSISPEHHIFDYSTTPSEFDLIKPETFKKGAYNYIKQINYIPVKQLNVTLISSGLRETNVLSFVSENILLDDKQEIIAICIDHAMYRGSRYSCIDAYDVSNYMCLSSVITGDIVTRGTPHKDGTLASVFRYSSVHTFQLEEKIYPHMVSGLAISPTTIIPMIIFIIQPAT